MSPARPAVGLVGLGVGDKIRSLRRERKLTLEALSARLADLGRPLDLSALARMEKGQRRIYVDDLVALASALDIAPSQLLPTEPPAQVDAGSNERNPQPKSATATRRRIDFLEPTGPAMPVDARRAIDMVKGYLDAEYSSLRIELGRQSLPNSYMDPIFYANALTAFAVRSLTHCSGEDAARSITDGPGNNGLDAIYFDQNRHELILIQTKWGSNGSARPDRSDILRAITGLEALLSLQFDGFNDAVRAKENLVMAALGDPQIHIRLVLCFPGSLTSISELIDDGVSSLVARMNKFMPLVSIQTFELSRMLHEIEESGPNNGVTLRLTLDQSMRVPGKFDSYIGMAKASQIAEWYRTAGDDMFVRNMRTYLGDTSVNSEIAESLHTAPEHFSFLNNGITILAESVAVRRPDNTETSIPTRQALEVHASNVSVVNGAQTIVSIYNAQLNQQEVGAVSVLVRIIVMPPKGSGAYEITKAVNTTNPVQPPDMAALDPAQLMLRTEIARMFGKEYSTKRGGPILPARDGCTVSEAIIALACTHEDPGLTAHAMRNAAALWTEHYEDLFGGPPPAHHVWRSVLLRREVVNDLRTLAVESTGRYAAFVEFGVNLVTHIVFALSSFAVPNSKQLGPWEEWLDARGDLVRIVVDTLAAAVNDLFGPASMVSTTFGNPERCRRLIDSISMPSLLRCIE
ncbi:AIPR family protein [Nocardia sienata]|uniref:AIPR family protein n=1 Tax=Nocardia sienata TaxID=248552 RepID=UPI000A00115D|nr:AIPR family protein [Nocardia sienata]